MQLRPLSIQKLGAQSGMPTKDEVDAFLSSNTKELNRTLKAPPAGSDYGLRPSQGQSRFESPSQLQQTFT